MKKKIEIFLFAFVLLTIFSPIVSAAETLVLPLNNPLETTSLYAIMGRLISALLGLSGAAALLMFVWGGFLWLTSRGESGPITKGKDTLKWATIGLVVIFTAYMLVNAVITSLTSGNALNIKSGATPVPAGPQSQSVCPPGTQDAGTGVDIAGKPGVICK